MSTKHTPGPWVFLEEGRTEEFPNAGRPLNICGPSDNSDLIAELYSCDDATVSTPRAEAIANARLIAAAPELLEALQLIVQWDDCGLAPIETLIYKARAAIAKATDKSADTKGGTNGGEGA